MGDGDGQNSQPDTPGRKPRVSNDIWRQAFLAQYSINGNISVSAKKAMVARSTVLKARAEDPEFAAAMLDAHEQAMDLLEDAARTRSVDGYDEPVFQNGVEVGKRRKYSDSLTMFLLDRKRYPRSVIVETGEEAREAAKKIADFLRETRGTIPDGSDHGEALP